MCFEHILVQKSKHSGSHIPTYRFGFPPTEFFIHGRLIKGQVTTLKGVIIIPYLLS